MQIPLFDNIQDDPENLYRPFITAVENGKGVLDVDTVKGCELGMAAHPDGGCYGECYANKTAARYGLDFTKSITRKLFRSNRVDVYESVKNTAAEWYRIGVAGDPSHDWDNTIAVIKFLSGANKTAVIVTKHWLEMTDEHLEQFKRLNVVFNTSVSGLDTTQETYYRVGQLRRIMSAGIKSIARVVTCQFGQSDFARRCKEKQDYLLGLGEIIDNPLRASKNNKLAQNGHIILTRKEESVGGGKYVSLHHWDVYLGTCGDCPDQCGVDHAKQRRIVK